MANIKITDLDAYADPKSTDVLPAVDVTNDETKKVSIADLMENAGSGTEALPGIAFDGDPNTGIYRPAADQLAISTAGTQRLLISDTGAVTIPGDLTVQGTTTTIDSETLVVKDKNIEMGSVATPTDTTADGGGITLKGATDKTINWVNATDAWTSSERFDFPAGTQAAPSIILNGDVNSGIYQPGADQVAISTAGTGRLFIDADGNVGVSTADGDIFNRNDDRFFGITASSASHNLSLQLNAGASAGRGAQIYLGQGGTRTATLGSNLSETSFGTSNSSALRLLTVDLERLRITSTGEFAFKGAGSAGVSEAVYFSGSAPVDSLVVDSNGRLGVGTSSPGNYAANADDLVVSSTGITGITIASGTTSTGNLFFADGTTGNEAYRGYLIYDHSSDFMRLGTADVERVRIDSSGRVGIWTAAPSEKLEVTGNAILDASNATLKIKAGGAGNTGSLLFTYDTDSVAYGGIDLTFDNRDTVGTRLFSEYAVTIRNGGGGSKPTVFTSGSTEIGRWDGSGRFLVGTPLSPNAGLGQYSRLHVAGYTGGSSGEGIMSIARGELATAMSNLDTVGQLGFTDNAGNDFAKIFAYVDGTPGTGDHPGALRFATNPGLPSGTPLDRMTIRSDGKIGIGTTSPFDKLHVKTVTDANFVFSSVGGTEASLEIFNDAGLVNTPLNLRASEYKFKINGDEKVRIDSSGRLLVGTNSAIGDYLFVVHGRPGSTAQPGTMALRRGGVVGENYSLGQLDFTDASNNVSARIVGGTDIGWSGSGDSPGILSFSTTPDGLSSPTERIRINSSGIVQIRQSLRISGSGGGEKTLIYTGSSNDVYPELAGIYSDGNYSVNTATDLLFKTTTGGNTSPTERMRIDSSGYLRLSSNSPGIQFNGDTAAANALDDYEEGSWTPNFNATGATFTTLYNAARYTKIGNLVKLSGYCQIYCSAGAGANAVVVTGLPFTSANISNFYQGSMLGAANFFNATGYGLSAGLQPNATAIDLLKSTDVSGSKRIETLKSQDITSSGFSFRWTLEYQVA